MAQNENTRPESLDRIKPKKKEDLRIRRTYKLLTEALIALLETKSFDDVSVVEICDAAMVHRATFYKHFTDKYDFVAYVIRKKIHELYYETIKVLDNFPESVDDYMLLIKTMIENVTDFCEQNRRLLMLSISAPSSNLFFESLSKTIASEVETVLRYLERTTYSFSVPTDFLSKFIAGGIINVIQCHIVDAGGLSKQQICDYMYNIVTDNALHGLHGE